MRVGVIAHNKYPLVEPMFGGLEAFTYDLVLALQARGHHVVLFGVTGSSKQLGLVSCLSPTSLGGPDYGPDELASRAHHEYLSLMLGIDRYALDVIFNNSLHYVPATMATLVKTPMLTVLHTPPIAELVLAYSHPDVGGYLCTPSHANAQSWKALITDCEIIPNAVDLELWKPRGSKSGYAIWSGRIVPEKGLHLAIDAAKVAQIPLRIAGPISDFQYYEACIRPRLDECATYLGHLSRPMLAQEVASASVAVVTPRWEEPFGLVVAEAIASGTPVAGFSRGALVELVTPDIGVLADPEDVLGLGRAILSARELSTSRCRAVAQSRWSFDDHVSRYERALSKVAHPWQSTA